MNESKYTYSLCKLNGCLRIPRDMTSKQNTFIIYCSILNRRECLICCFLSFPWRDSFWLILLSEDFVFVGGRVFLFMNLSFSTAITGTSRCFSWNQHSLAGISLSPFAIVCIPPAPQISLSANPIFPQFLYRTLPLPFYLNVRSWWKRSSCCPS